MTEKDKRHIFDDPKNVKRIVYLLFLVCAASLLGEFFVHRHMDHAWEAMFGFYAFYGFVACVTLVLIATGLRKLLMRGEDYYEKRD